MAGPMTGATREGSALWQISPATSKEVRSGASRSALRGPVSVVSVLGGGPPDGGWTSAAAAAAAAAGGAVGGAEPEAAAGGPGSPGMGVGCLAVGDGLGWPAVGGALWVEGRAGTSSNTGLSRASADRLRGPFMATPCARRRVVCPELMAVLACVEAACRLSPHAALGRVALASSGSGIPCWGTGSVLRTWGGGSSCSRCGVVHEYTSL